MTFRCGPALAGIFAIALSGCGDTNGLGPMCSSNAGCDPCERCVERVCVPDEHCNRDLCGGMSVWISSGAKDATFGSLQSAYGAAKNDDELHAVDGNFNEDLTCDGSTAVTISGGYDCDFKPTGGLTTIRGSMTIGGQATVTLDHLAIE